MNGSLIDNPADVRQGEELNKEALHRYLLQNLAEHAGDLTIKQFPRGFSNLTYLLKFNGKEYVLRRPPFGVNIQSAHDINREYKILNALSGSFPKVPEPVLICKDEAILGAPFYLMERVRGVIFRPGLKEDSAPGFETMKEISQSFIQTMYELHNIDYKEVGLSDLGNPEGYVYRQIKGWSKRYENAKTDKIPSVEKVARWLWDNIPAESGSALIHNDYKYDNLILDPDNLTRIVAVLDWEMSTIGDPMMDVGTTLGYWVNREDPDWMHDLALCPTTLPGNPSRQEVYERYIQASGRNPVNVVYYYVYGLFKIAVIVQQIFKRYQMGLTLDKRFKNLNKAVKGLGIMGIQAIQKQKIDNLF